MRSLFTKIFLWFWLAHVLMAGTLILTTFGVPFDSQHSRMQAMVRHILRLTGERAISTFEHNGREALLQEVGDFAETAAIDLYVYDKDGREILGRTAPDNILAIVSRSRRTGQVALSIPPRLVAAAQTIHGSNGRSYLVAFGPTQGRSEGELWGLSPTFVMRLGIVVLVAGIVCSALARYLTSPLRALRLSAQQLAGGNLSVRVGKVAARRHDEIGALGRDFDLMAEQLESLVSAQRRLFQDMSHELHSPLARLHMALGLANQKGASGIADELKRIEREAGRLNDLVRELLTLARLEGGVPVPDEESIDLEELVQAIVADGDYEARNRNRRVQLNHCDACIITGSPNVLRRSVENVVRNGIRYTKEGSQVEVSLHTEQCEGTLQAVIRIRDYGPGVPVDALEAIFRPFHRVEMDRNQQTGGVGLGLAIAHQAVRIHGGTISAANAPDAGLIVKICLPLRITHRS